MTKNNKITFGVLTVIVIGVLIALVRSGSGDQSASQQQDGVYKVGVLLPLTGDAASYGEPAKKIYDIAVSEINDAGGINGKKIELVTQDSKCAAGDAVKAASQLIDVEKVQIIVGGFCSSESLAVVPVAEKAKVAMYNPSSSSPLLTGKSKYFIRNYPSDSAQGKGLADYAVKNNLKKVGVLVEQTDYALGVDKVFESALVEQGGTITHEEFPKDGTDFRSQLAKLRAANPDVLTLIVQTPASGERIVKQLRDLNWKPKLFLSDSFVGEEKLLTDNKDMLEGAVYMTFAGDVTNPKAATMLTKFKAAHGQDPAFADSYALTEYDIIYMAAGALKAIGYNGEKIAEHGRMFKDFDGASGKISIGEDGDRQNTVFVIKTVKDGKSEILK